MQTRPAVDDSRLAAEDPVIWARGLTKAFGDEVVVQDLDMSVPHGQIFGFVGPSGSGKTTTLRLLTGVYRPTSGEVSVLGAAPSRFTRQQRERIGYMPQHFVLSLLARTTSQAVQYAMIVLLTSIFFSGFFLSLQFLWQPVRAVSWMLPATYAIPLLQDLMLRGTFEATNLLLFLVLIGVIWFVTAWVLLRRMMAQR